MGSPCCSTKRERCRIGTRPSARHSLRGGSVGWAELPPATWPKRGRHPHEADPLSLFTMAQPAAEARERGRSCCRSGRPISRQWNHRYATFATSQRCRPNTSNGAASGHACSRTSPRSRLMSTSRCCGSPTTITTQPTVAARIMARHLQKGRHHEPEAGGS